MKTVLLTGATGFIGRQVAVTLSEAGYRVEALHWTSEVPEELIAGAVSWRRVNLFDEQAVDALMDRVRPDRMLHLAWSVVPGGYDDVCHQNWLEASRRLVRRFYECGGERAAIAGSCFEYDWSDGHCVETETPRKPSTLYGKCKWALCQELQERAAAACAGWAWGRIFFVYGPHEGRRRLVASIVTNLLEGRAARCTHGRQIRDFLHSRDVASALARLLDRDWNGEYNIASGEAVTLRQVGEWIGDRIGRRELLQFGAISAPEGEPPRITADVSRLRNQLGWKPEFGWRDGLEDTIEWWRSRVREEADCRTV